MDSNSGIAAPTSTISHAADQRSRRRRAFPSRNVSGTTASAISGAPASRGSVPSRLNTVTTATTAPIAATSGRPRRQPSTKSSMAAREAQVEPE